jgi:hypothetical protein
MHRGGRGDARASCASPLGTPLSLGLHKVTEEAFRSQKGPSNTSKHELLQLFSTSVGHFALLDPDPDPQPWIDDGRR